MARPRAVFTLNFTLLHAKAANNSLIMCEYLARYFKKTLAQCYQSLKFLQLYNLLNGRCENSCFQLSMVTTGDFCHQPRKVDPPSSPPHAMHAYINHTLCWHTQRTIKTNINGGKQR